MTFTQFTRFCFGLAIAALFAGLGAYAFAQTVPQQQLPKSCEERLEEAQSQIFELRKAAAQAEFRSAAIEQAAVGIQKQLAIEQAKTKAAQGERK